MLLIHLLACVHYDLSVLEHSIPSKSDPVFSKHFDLLLTRHDVPPPLSPSPIPSGPDINPALPFRTDKPRAPVLHYSISTPTHAIGPTDLLFTSVFIRPADTSVTLRSASLLIERRLVLYDLDRPVSPPSTSRSHALVTPGPSSSERVSIDHNVFAFGVARSPSWSSTTAPSFAYPSPPTSSEATGRPKMVTTTVAVAQAATFSLDRATGVWTKTLSLQWPTSKGQSRWPIGETVSGALGAVSFWVKVKVTLVAGARVQTMLTAAVLQVIVTSPSGTETIDLQPREILVVLTSDAERRLALDGSGSTGEFSPEYMPPPYTAPAPTQLRPAADRWGWGHVSLPHPVSPNGDFIAPRTADSVANVSPRPQAASRSSGFRGTLARLLGRSKRPRQ